MVGDWLEKAGFDVERGAGGLPTAVHGTFGDGPLHVALLAEYDLIAIHEDDIGSPRLWTAHFASSETRDAAADAIRALPDAAGIQLDSVDVEDEDWARRRFAPA